MFRNGEVGSRHNPEFTMLEWYRPGFDEQQLIDEVEALVASMLPEFQAERISYRALFQRELGFDPHQADLATLQRISREHLDAPFEDEQRDTWLGLLMSHVLEPRLQQPTFVTRNNFV